jgi:hypothetical protein
LTFVSLHQRFLSLSRSDTFGEEKRITFGLSHSRSEKRAREARFSLRERPSVSRSERELPLVKLEIQRSEKNEMGFDYCSEAALDIASSMFPTR